MCRLRKPFVSLNKRVHSSIKTCNLGYECVFMLFAVYSDELIMHIHLHFCNSSQSCDALNLKYNVPCLLQECVHFQNKMLALAYSSKLSDELHLVFASVRNISIYHLLHMNKQPLGTTRMVICIGPLLVQRQNCNTVWDLYI